jgi:hypothetical protein
MIVYNYIEPSAKSNILSRKPSNNRSTNQGLSEEKTLEDEGITGLTGVVSTMRQSPRIELHNENLFYANVQRVQE